MIEVSESHDGSVLRLPQGDVLLIRLPENPTTGYRWQFSQSGSGALQVSEDRFEAHPHSDAAAPGANGLRVIRFNATQRGQVRMSLGAKVLAERYARAQDTRVSGRRGLTGLEKGLYVRDAVT